MFRTAECVEVCEDGITFNLSRILHAEVSRIGIHTHDLLLDFFRFFGQIDTVAEWFAHLGFTVSTRQTQAGSIVRQQDFRFHQCFAIDIVETADYFACLFEHRFLVFAYGDSRCTECSDVRSLTDRISEEAYGNACLEVTHLDFRFHGRVTLQAGYAYKVHIVEAKFA